MCDPVSVALTIASTAYGLHSQAKTASAQEKALRKQQATQDEQIQAQASVDANARYQQAREERARLRAASAESGVAGISIVDLLDNVDFQAGTDIALIGQGMTNRRNASRDELGARLSQIQQPDYIGESLNAGLQIYRMSQAPKRPTPPGGP